jgi:hypothetical protein
MLVLFLPLWVEFMGPGLAAEGVHSRDEPIELPVSSITEARPCPIHSMTNRNAIQSAGPPSDPLRFETSLEQLNLLVQAAENSARLNLATAEWLRQVVTKLREHGADSFAAFLERQAIYISAVSATNKISICRAYDAIEHLGSRHLATPVRSNARADKIAAAGKIPNEINRLGAVQERQEKQDEKCLHSIASALKSLPTREHGVFSSNIPRTPDVHNR